MFFCLTNPLPITFTDAEFSDNRTWRITSAPLEKSPTPTLTNQDKEKGKLKIVLEKLLTHGLILLWHYRIVEFADRRGLDYALDKLDNTELDGRKIRLVEEGGRGGGRGGGGARRSASRSKSRSRSRSRSRSERRSRSPASRSRSGSRGSRWTSPNRHFKQTFLLIRRNVTQKKRNSCTATKNNQ